MAISNIISDMKNIILKPRHLYFTLALITLLSTQKAIAQNNPQNDSWKEVPSDTTEIINNRNINLEEENTTHKIEAKHQDTVEKINENAPEEAWDPFEPVNRGIFWFNDKADTYFMGPVSRGYDFIMPDFAQTGVKNLFNNLAYPVDFASDFITFDFEHMGLHTSRFLINSTLGLLGLFDVASSMGLDDVDTDIGLALKDNDVPAGPYLVLPLLGASNVRDGLSLGASAFIHPFAIVGYCDVRSGITDKLTIGGTSLNSLQTRVDAEEALKSAKEGSVDYYLFMQSAYYQYRNGKLKKLRGEITDDNLPSENADDSNESNEWDF